MNKRRIIRENVIDTGTGSRVNRLTNTVTGIKLLGWESANGRFYDPESMRKYVTCYDDCAVNFDHTSDRRFKERFGWIANAVWREDGIYGDLSFNPLHSDVETFLWWCENKPNKLGMSHSVIAEGEPREDGVIVITRIIRVESVDIVADPATTKGMFESMDATKTPPETPVDVELTLVDHAIDMIKTIFAADGDFASKKTKAISVLKLLDDGTGVPTPTDDEPEEPEEDEYGNKKDKDEEDDDADADKKDTDKDDKKPAGESRVKALLYDAKLTVGESFVKGLVGLPIKNVKLLIADRKKVKEATGVKPTSASPGKPTAPRSRESIVSNLRS